MVQGRQQNYKVKASVAHKHFAKRLRRAVQQQRSCALLRVYGLCFFGISGKRIAGGFRPRLILKKENWSCMLTGKSVFLSYTYSMTDLISRSGFLYKNCCLFQQTLKPPVFLFLSYFLYKKERWRVTWINAISAVHREIQRILRWLKCAVREMVCVYKKI